MVYWECVPASYLKLPYFVCRALRFYGPIQTRASRHRCFLQLSRVKNAAFFKLDPFKHHHKVRQQRHMTVIIVLVG